MTSPHGGSASPALAAYTRLSLSDADPNKEHRIQLTTEESVREIWRAKDSKHKLAGLFEQNRLWAQQKKALDPNFFSRLLHQQTPDYLWIGCADSRVPANEIVGLEPGQLFVHRNVANCVVHSDLNCLSVMQYAVDVLKVKHIIVCGHYGCGGVKAALLESRVGLVDNWLRHVQDVKRKHAKLLMRIVGETDEETEHKRWERLCELNVIEQVVNVCQTTILVDAWKRGQRVSVHGWIYGLHDGLIVDLNMCVTRKCEIHENEVEGYGDAVHQLSQQQQQQQQHQRTTEHTTTPVAAATTPTPRDVRSISMHGLDRTHSFQRFSLQSVPAPATPSTSTAAPLPAPPAVDAIHSASVHRPTSASGSDATHKPILSGLIAQRTGGGGGGGVLPAPHRPHTSSGDHEKEKEQKEPTSSPSTEVVL